MLALYIIGGIIGTIVGIFIFTVGFCTMMTLAFKCVDWIEEKYL